MIKLIQILLKSEINVLKKIGIQIIQKKNSIIIKKAEKLKKINITTKPYPGFPTDLTSSTNGSSYPG